MTSTSNKSKINNKEKCSGVDHDIEAAILDLLNQRGAGKTICPSEAARKLAPENWQSLMGQTRAAVYRLAAAGQIEVTQRGRPVDMSRVKGPIRLRRG